MKKFFLIFLGMSLAVGFVICSGTQHVIAAEKSKYGGILRANHAKQAGIIGDPLDIFAWNHEFVDFVLQLLIRRSPERYGEYDPELALSWEVAPDKTHIDFKLRKGVKFHDGTDFNAQAAKWNLDRWVGSPRPALSAVKSIDVIDGNTIRVNLSTWNAVVIDDFTRGVFAISPTSFEKKGQEWAKYNPVGTDAFKVVEMKRNTYIKYERFADFYEKDLPYLDGVVFTMIPDPMTASASLKRGEVDALTGVDPVTGDAFRKTGGFNIIKNPGLHQIIYFNSEAPSSIWSDKRLREALEYAIDKEKIAKVILRDFSFPVYEILHSINISAPSAGVEVGTVPRKYNPDKARQLLKEAGHSEGLKVKLSYNSASPEERDMFMVIQADLKDVGIEVVPDPLTAIAVTQKQLEPLPPNELCFDAQRGGSTLSLPGVVESFHPDSVFFKGAKKPEGFADLLSKVMQTFDPEEQLQIFAEMERMAYGMAMFTPITGNNFLVIQHPKVKDAIWFYGGGPTPFFRRAWLSEK